MSYLCSPIRLESSREMAFDDLVFRGAGRFPGFFVFSGTEHRISLTVHNLAEVMDGELGKILEALAAHDQAERLRQEVEA